MVYAIAAEGATLVDTFTSALGTVQTDVMQYIGLAVPAGLAIMGTILAITIGIKAFKRFAK